MEKSEWVRCPICGNKTRFDVIQNNSHACFSCESEESMQAFFDIMQDRDKTPEQRADILMNGTVRV